MHDIKFIRNKPNEFQLLMEKRGLKIDLPEILELDSQIRNYQTSIQEIQEKRNNTSKDIGKLISQILLALPIIALYEISIIFSKFLNKS